MKRSSKMKDRTNRRCKSLYLLIRISIFIVGLGFLTIVPLTLTRSDELKTRHTAGSKNALQNQRLSRAVQPSVQSEAGAQPRHVTEAGMRQIASLLAEKESRTPAQQKIDSQLLQAVRESRGQSMATDVH